MKHKYKDIEGSRREFSVEIPHEEVLKVVEKTYEEIKGSVTIPGFRKGKVPRDILEKHHGPKVREQALEDLVRESYVMALRESKTIPLGLPNITDVEFKEGETATYKATVDMRPRIDIKNYKGIKVKKQPSAVSDDDVEKYMTMLRESYAEFKTIEDRPAKEGDYVICDIVCEVEGKPLHDEQKNILLALDKKNSLPELVDGLAGVKKGDTKEIKAMLPESKADPKAPKKEGLFKIKVNLVKEKELPKIDDEFVKGLGAYKTVAELKDAAKKDIARKKENESKNDMTNQIMAHLVSAAKFTPPKGLVDEEAERLVAEAKEDLKKKQVKTEDIEKKDAEIRATLEKEAARRVKIFFLLDQIGAIEKVEVADKEVDEMLVFLASQSNAPVEKVKKHYEENDLIRPLKNQLRESKVIQLLLDKADVAEA